MAYSSTLVTHGTGQGIVIVTGDHAGTAGAIARQVGLCGESCSIHTREVITGRDLADYRDEDLPVLPLQILWVNMTTALQLGKMLAFGPREPGLMQRSPRDPDEPILGRP